MRELNLRKSFKCSCGRTHETTVDKIVVGSGAIDYLPQAVKSFGAKKAFVIADKNTYAAAGDKVCKALKNSNIAYTLYAFDIDRLEPDERAVGCAALRFDRKSDIVISVGSGVINDIGKILANIKNAPYVVVATAPSMDGYASATSSMSVDNLKVSVPSKCPEVIIGDTDVLKNCPENMLKAGLGDMLAKYVSIGEWRISNVITGEYYCEEIADVIRKALKACVDNAEGLLNRDEKAAEAVFEGLILGGVAMSYAGISRPASGVEHYFSHVYDMRNLAFGTPASLHGIQCAIGTFSACKIYDYVRTLTPDINKALSFVAGFDKAKWFEDLKNYVGKGADVMIKADEKDLKYDARKHAARFKTIAENWDKIVKIINEEIPSSAEIKRIAEKAGLPTLPEEIGLSSRDLPVTFAATKDIRDKYVLSRLCFDLGVLDEAAALLYK